MNGFKSPLDYQKFATAIKKGPRFVQSEGVTNFLEAVARGSEAQKVGFPTGTSFWRAQIGSGQWQRSDETGNQWEEEIPHGPERMVPQPHLVQEGRINPRGIAYLYLATDKKTAVAEVRPYVGAHVTLAWFRTTREITVVDLSRNMRSEGPPVTDLFWWELLAERGEPLSQEEIDRTVWASIDFAFARPVDPHDERLSYLPTQVIAESIMAMGFDGVAYRSGLNPDGYNLALFNLDLAEFRGAQLVEVERVKYKSKEWGNPWFYEDGKFFTAEITDVRPVDGIGTADIPNDGAD